jgi:Curli production assembly/transport component CsgG
MIYSFVRKLNRVLWATLLVALLSLLPNWNAPAVAQEAELTTAVLPFAVKGQDTNLIKELMSRVKNRSQDKPDTLGEEFALLLTQELSETYGIPLVERTEMDSALSEVALGESGIVDPSTAAKIGHITGAKVIVTGRMFQVQSQMVIVAKIIGVETSRVFAHTVSIPRKGSVQDAAGQLALKIAEKLTAKGSTLVAKAENKQSSIEKLQGLLKNYNAEDFPVVSIDIDEMNMDKEVLDPAAQTELRFIMQGVGFELVDLDSTTKLPDVQIKGEAFSEFGLRRGNLVSSKGRVEVTVIERATGRILASDREVVVAVDLSPTIAGKKALQNATAQLSERLVPALLKRMKTKTQ